MSRQISWIGAADKQFRKFPPVVQLRMAAALQLALRGEKADIVKPMIGLGSGVFEIALPYFSDAYRAIYAVKIGDDIWVVDAFKKKSKQGIKTPREDIDRIKRRLKRLREQLK